MDPQPSGQRTLRAPSTITKPSSKGNLYSNPNSYFAQNKFRIINPAGSSTITRPTQNLQQHSPDKTIVPTAAITTIGAAPTTSPANQIQSGKPSGLVRPTPIKQVVPLAVAHSLRPPQTKLASTAFGSSSRLATLRQSNATFQRQSTANVEKPKALNRTKISSSHLQAQDTNQTIVVSTATISKLSATSTTSSLPSNNKSPNCIDISSLETDVGQIRKLLEQLLTLLKTSNDDKETLERDKEILKKENDRLKGEVLELKGKIRAIRSTVGAQRDSELQFGCGSGLRNEFNQRPIFSTVSKEAAVNSGNNNADNKPESSIYLSPLG